MLTFCLQTIYNIVVISILNRANIRYFFYNLLFYFYFFNQWYVNLFHNGLEAVLIYMYGARAIEDREQRTEYRGQRTEDREQMKDER